MPVRAVSVTDADPLLGKLRDLSSWLAGALGLPLLSAELHLHFTGPACGWAHAATSAPPILAWLLGSIPNRNKLTELVVLSSSMSIGILSCLNSNAFGIAAATTMLGLSGIINVNLADQLGVNRDDLFRIGLCLFNCLIVLSAKTQW